MAAITFEFAAAPSTSIAVTLAIENQMPMERDLI